MTYLSDSGGKSSAGFDLRVKHRPVPGEVRDAPSLGILMAVRFMRAMVLWIVIFFVDRAYQESYVQRVLVDPTPLPAPGEEMSVASASAAVGQDGPSPPSTAIEGRPPPRLWTLPAAALALEGGIVFLLCSIVFMLNARFKQPDNAFVIDRAFLGRLASDYAITTAVILLVGTAFAAVSQDDRLFRYREDGLRGIRAFSTMFLLSSLAVLLAGPVA